MPEEHVRIQIAFEGGQIVPALVTAAAAEGLGTAMANGDAVFELDAEDGTYLIALSKVVYVRTSSRETRIGFGVSP